ncbi:molecular chaperone GroEL, partial [bacterium]|nr:molecular chaperone GroEL [bacterium]
AQAALEDLKLLGDQAIGITIIKRSLEEPARVIAGNAGFDPAVVVEKIKTADKNVGFDARNEAYVDMFKAGVVDPTKVTRTAVQNAASIASLLLTTETMIAELPEEKPAQQHAGHAHGGMGGMGGMY